MSVHVNKECTYFYIFLHELRTTLLAWEMPNTMGGSPLGFAGLEYRIWIMGYRF